MVTGSNAPTNVIASRYALLIIVPMNDLSSSSPTNALTKNTTLSVANAPLKSSCASLPAKSLFLIIFAMSSAVVRNGGMAQDLYWVNTPPTDVEPKIDFDPCTTLQRPISLLSSASRSVVTTPALNSCSVNEPSKKVLFDLTVASWNSPNNILPAFSTKFSLVFASSSNGVFPTKFLYFSTIALPWTVLVLINPEAYFWVPSCTKLVMFSPNLAEIPTGMFKPKSSMAVNALPALSNKSILPPCSIPTILAVLPFFVFSHSFTNVFNERSNSKPLGVRTLGVNA